MAFYFAILDISLDRCGYVILTNMGGRVTLGPNLFNMTGKNKEYLSKEKFDELNIELENLKSKKRKEIADELEFAKSLGDLSENAEYHEAREAQAALEDRIAQLESILANAEIIGAHHSNVVEVGAVVHVKKTGDKAEKAYTIVGS